MIADDLWKELHDSKDSLLHNHFCLRSADASLPKHWRAGDQKVDKVEMERFKAEVERVLNKQECVRLIPQFRNYRVQLVLRRIVYRIRWSDHGDAACF